MSSEAEFFRRVIDALDAAGIPAMVCGSVASSIHGEARSTNDIDLVVTSTPQQLAVFIDALPKEFYVSREAAADALRRESMFNVLDPDGGYKADVIFRKSNPYDRAAFDRRTPTEVLGLTVPVLTPEDAILSKLDWARESGSERQLRDVLTVAVTQWGNLDRAYLGRWAAELGLTEALDEIMRKAERQQLR